MKEDEDVVKKAEDLLPLLGTSYAETLLLLLFNGPDSKDLTKVKGKVHGIEKKVKAEYHVDMLKVNGALRWASERAKKRQSFM